MRKTILSEILRITMTLHRAMTIIPQLPTFGAGGPGMKQVLHLKCHLASLRRLKCVLCSLCMSVRHIVFVYAAFSIANKICLCEFYVLNVLFESSFASVCDLSTFF